MKVDSLAGLGNYAVLTSDINFFVKTQKTSLSNATNPIDGTEDSIGTFKTLLYGMCCWSIQNDQIWRFFGFWETF